MHGAGDEGGVNRSGRYAVVGEAKLEGAVEGGEGEEHAPGIAGAGDADTRHERMLTLRGAARQGAWAAVASAVGGKTKGGAEGAHTATK